MCAGFASEIHLHIFITSKASKWCSVVESKLLSERIKRSSRYLFTKVEMRAKGKKGYICLFYEWRGGRKASLIFNED